MKKRDNYFTLKLMSKGPSNIFMEAAMERGTGNAEVGQLL